MLAPVTSNSKVHLTRKLISSTSQLRWSSRFFLNNNQCVFVVSPDLKSLRFSRVIIFYRSFCVRCLSRPNQIIRSQIIWLVRGFRNDPIGGLTSQLLESSFVEDDAWTSAGIRVIDTTFRNVARDVNENTWKVSANRREIRAECD